MQHLLLSAVVSRWANATITRLAKVNEPSTATATVGLRPAAADGYEYVAT
jgi:hypothetical protein